MRADFYIGQGDTLPKLTARLENGDGTYLDLTDADTVLLVMRRPLTDAAPISRAGEVVGEPTDGRIRVSWEAADTAVAGLYEAQVQVTFNDGSVVTFPNLGFLRIAVNEHIDSSS